MGWKFWHPFVKGWREEEARIKALKAEQEKINDRCMRHLVQAPITDFEQQALTIASFNKCIAYMLGEIAFLRAKVEELQRAHLEKGGE